MCGIAGTLDPSGLPREALREIASGMGETLRHRGPDDAGVWVDASAGVALAHRRLAVIDLSEAGRQPMASAYGRYVVTFNGEIYNFRGLRAELERRGHRFRGSSDTEVLLAAVTEWGVPRAVERCNGMFAFALWDRLERRLYLARDRAGEKPLYYGRLGSAFVFASELKALRAHPAGVGGIDRSSLALYLRYGYIPAPHSIYRQIRKLPPAALVTVDAAGQASEPVAYWSARQAAEIGVAQPFSGSPPEACEQLAELLRDSVRLRTAADVPVGAFLSGGVDSSLVVALMPRPVRTFTIGFREPGFDEAAHARAVARHLGAEHTELYVTPSEAAAVIPKLPQLYDEPFADASQIPTCLVSELARREVTVALSGDGGDELFGGYQRYYWAEAIWRAAGWLPAPIRKGLSAPLRLSRGKLARGGELVAAPTAESMYLRLVSNWDEPAAAVIGATEPLTPASDAACARGLPDRLLRMMLLDTVTYLPGDILTKLDRATMAAGLEARAPLLDHRLIEFAWRLPLALRKRKWLLKQILSRHVRPALIDRPKRGFAVPLHAWIRGPLREWAEDLLDERRLRADGYFQPAAIHRKWTEHLAGRRNWTPALWSVLMFQSWLEHEHCSAAVSDATPVRP